MNESLGYTGSARTRSKVRSWFRQQEREKNISQGREIVMRELKRLGVADIYSLNDLVEALHFDDQDQFLAKVGFGDVQSTQIGGAIAALEQKLRPDDELRPLLNRKKPVNTDFDQAAFIDPATRSVQVRQYDVYPPYSSDSAP